MLDVACQPNTLDIANAVRGVARYANTPREVHWSTAIGILEYVFGTSDLGVMFRRGRGLSWQDSLPRTMSARPLIGGQFPVGLWCVRVRAYAGFLGLRSASHSVC